MYLNHHGYALFYFPLLFQFIRPSLYVNTWSFSPISFTTEQQSTTLLPIPWLLYSLPSSPPSLSSQTHPSPICYILNSSSSQRWIRWIISVALSKTNYYTTVIKYSFIDLHLHSLIKKKLFFSCQFFTIQLTYNRLEF